MPDDTLRFKPLLDFIARHEGTDGQPGGGYNTSLGYGAYTGGEHQLVAMTLDRIDQLQTQMLHHPQNHFHSSALGRYQIVRTTLRGLREQFDLASSTLFSAGLQDRLGAALIRRRGRSPNGLRMEWASLHGVSDGEILAAYDMDGSAGHHAGPLAATESPVVLAPADAVMAEATADAPDATGSILLDLARGNHLEAPAQRLIDYWKTHNPGSRPRHWAIIDFDLRSSLPRLFVYDVVAKTVDSYLCAHGRGSEGDVDDGFATVFSNKPKSNASSLGIYRCSEEFFGSHGQSMRLDGLEASNSNARSRKVYVHSALYVSPEFIAKTGRIGRSKGCPAVDVQAIASVVRRLKDGSYMIAWRS